MVKIEVVGVKLIEVLKWMEAFNKNGFETELESSEGRIWINLRKRKLENN